MNEIDKLRVLLPHWVEHNGEHAGEFRAWAERARAAGEGHLAEHIEAAAAQMEAANQHLESAIAHIGGADGEHPHPHLHPHHAEEPVETMRMLAIISGDYGRRHVENIRTHSPAGWTIETWDAPVALPLVIDYPEDYVSETLSPADLILSFAEIPGVAELLPEIARITGARAVTAGVDQEAWLPRGLARQLRGWLADMGVACVTPKPLCSLTETHYSLRRYQETYSDQKLPGYSLIAAFAHHFGRPELRLVVDHDTRIITAVEVVRDAFCGCTRFVAEGLVGTPADEAEQKAGLLHHHFPCLAGMIKDIEFSDTLMHVSGNILKDQVAEQVRPYRNIHYIAPDKRSDA